MAKDDVLVVRVTNETKEAIRQAAMARDQSMTAYIIEAGIEKACQGIDVRVEDVVRTVGASELEG